jgi:predicted  nucleic acid-binding Zn-ribbon protein
MDSELIHTGEEWAERARALQAELDQIRPRLIEAEAQLAERLAAVSAFEYRVRARLESLSHRLDAVQNEVDALRHELRRYEEDLLFGDDRRTTGQDGEPWRFDNVAAGGDFRYRARSETARPAPEGKRLVALKQLYRSLARRFHPDLAPDETERAYRTDLMMAINAAYAAGDLEALERLALEPDSVSRAPRSPEELAATLQREIDRCRRRLEEIGAELAALERHDSARLLRRAERAAAEGRDLLAELAADLRRRITEKMAERDALGAQLEEIEREGVEVSAADLADIVYNLGLEQADEDNLFGADRGWRPRDPRPWETNDGRDEEDGFDDTY